MNRTVNTVSDRLNLREPQRKSLEALAKAIEGKRPVKKLAKVVADVK